MTYVETQAFLPFLFLIYSAPKVENIFSTITEGFTPQRKISSVYGEVFFKTEHM